jgi:hypothetical protein
MQRGGAEGQQRHPLAVDFGHVTQRLACEPAALKIMLLLQIVIKLADFILRDQTHRHSIQNVAFARCFACHHAARLRDGRKESSHF